MTDIIVDAIVDSLKLFPFLFLIYAVIEVLEHNTAIGKKGGVLQGNLAPFLGALTGIVPQCGFSVMSAKLYDRKLIRTGTILSVFIATSDEAIIILLSDGTKALSVLPLIGLKLLLAVIVGYAANAFLKHERLDRTEEPIGACCEECDDCARVGNGFIERYILTPLYHSLKIFFFILAVNLVFGFVFYFAGEEQISAFLQRGYVFQPFLTALVGLIPNCASSVILTQTYILGGISFGGLFAGLCSNAGLGLVVLFKNPKNLKKNCLMVLVLYTVGTAAGLIIDLYCRLAM